MIWEYVNPDLALTIIFIVLKCLGLIDLSWWWVLSPLMVLPVFISILFVIVIQLETLHNLWGMLRNVRRGSNDER